MLEEWSQSDSRYPKWAGLPPHTQPLRHEPSAPQGRQPQAKGSAPNSGQPRARPRCPRAHARPRYQNISAARIRPARGAPSPLPAASSLRAPQEPLVRP